MSRAALGCVPNSGLQKYRCTATGKVAVAKARGWMTDDTTQARSEIILYQTEDGRTRIQCRFEGETL